MFVFILRGKLFSLHGKVSTKQLVALFASISVAITSAIAFVIVKTTLGH